MRPKLFQARHPLYLTTLYVFPLEWDGESEPLEHAFLSNINLFADYEYQLSKDAQLSLGSYLRRMELVPDGYTVCDDTCILIEEIKETETVEDYVP